MKYFFLLSVLVSLFCSCKKVAPGNSGSSPTQRLPYTLIPKDENTETNIIVLSLDNYVSASKIQVTDYNWPNDKLLYTADNFYNSLSSGQISSSIYTSHIYSRFTTAADYYRYVILDMLFPLTTGAKNYVDVNSRTYLYIGSISNGFEASTFNLPTKGKIFFLIIHLAEPP